MSHMSPQLQRRRLILWHFLGGCCDRWSYHNYGDNIMRTIKMQGCAEVTEICICYILNCWRNLSVRATHTFNCWTLLCRPSVVRLASLDDSWSCAVCSHLRREPERPRKCTSCCSQVWMAINLRERDKRNVTGATDVVRGRTRKRCSRNIEWWGKRKKNASGQKRGEKMQL